MKKGFIPKATTLPLFPPFRKTTEEEEEGVEVSDILKVHRRTKEEEEEEEAEREILAPRSENPLFPPRLGSGEGDGIRSGLHPGRSKACVCFAIVFSPPFFLPPRAFFLGRGGGGGGALFCVTPSRDSPSSYSACEKEDCRIEEVSRRRREFNSRRRKRKKERLQSDRTKREEEGGRKGRREEEERSICRPR